MQWFAHNIPKFALSQSLFVSHKSLRILDTVFDLEYIDILVLIYVAKKTPLIIPHYWEYYFFWLKLSWLTLIKA